MSHKLPLYVPVRLSLCEHSLLCLSVGRHASMIFQSWLTRGSVSKASGLCSRGQPCDLILTFKMRRQVLPRDGFGSVIIKLVVEQLGFYFTLYDCFSFINLAVTVLVYNHDLCSGNPQKDQHKFILEYILFVGGWCMLCKLLRV